MRLKKQIVALVKNDYKIFSENEELKLRGGFGEIEVNSDYSAFAMNNCLCNSNNFNCLVMPGSAPQNNCNCKYVYDASINNCDCNTTATPGPTGPTKPTGPTEMPSIVL